MLGLRLTIDCQPRTKNGCPAQSTTGNDSTSSIQVCAVMSNQPSWGPNMASTVTTMVKGSVHQNRREKSFSSGLSSDRKSTRLNSSHVAISYAVFCLKKKKYQ